MRVKGLEHLEYSQSAELRRLRLKPLNTVPLKRGIWALVLVRNTEYISSYCGESYGCKTGLCSCYHLVQICDGECKPSDAYYFLIYVAPFISVFLCLVCSYIRCRRRQSVQSNILVIDTRSPLLQTEIESYQNSQV